MEEKRKVEVYMDEGRNLYFREGGKEYKLIVRGISYANYYLETEGELKKEREERELREKIHYEEVMRWAKKRESRSWWKKFLDDIR